MSMFNKMKGFLDVVANSQITGQSGSIIWKHPSPAIVSGSRLIVGESQEAILVKGGKIVHIFDSGAYELNTQNLPFLQSFLNIPFGGKSPHQAEVWFVNKSLQLEVPWGTPSPIKVEDKIYGAILDIRSNGAISIKVSNSRNLFTSIAGQTDHFSLEELSAKTKSIVISKITDILVKFVLREEKSFTELNGHLQEIGEFMANSLASEFDKFGLSLEGCYIQKIEPVDNAELREVLELKREKKRRIDLIQVQAFEEKTLEMARIENQKLKMDTLGYDYKTEKQFDFLQAAASNESNPLIGGGMSLGMGVGLGSHMAGQVSEITRQSFTPATSEASNSGTKCSSCGTVAAKGVKFCPNCGVSLTRKCKDCNTEIDEGIKFCPECGKKANFCPKCLQDNNLDEEICVKCNNQLIEKSNTCSQCGCLSKDGVKFCPECGNKLI